ncbi:MAG: preprotein translocase subunit SecE [Candidatus Cloacimonadota bacterium]|nr:preprotein translocase subunit SecE [Candidatus Cloacimonadota bacterium]
MKKLTKFLKEVRHEMKYVSWPSMVDLKEGTTVVIVMSLFMAAFLSLLDFGFSNIIRLILF